MPCAACPASAVQRILCPPGCKNLCIIYAGSLCAGAQLLLSAKNMLYSVGP